MSENDIITKICNKCGETKLATKEFFNRASDYKDGFKSQCKLCTSEVQRSRYYKQKNVKPTVEFKICTCCGIEKPANNEYFYNKPNYTDGLNSQCKDCISRNEESIRVKNNLLLYGKEKLRKYRTEDDFMHEVFGLVGDEFSVLSEFVAVKVKVKFLHNKCGTEFNMNPSDFLLGQRCPKCAGTMKKSHDEFVKEVFDAVGDEYEILSTYVNSATKVKFKHKKCNKIFNMAPNNFTSQNQRCPHCNGKKLRTQNEFEEEVFKLVGSEYKILGKYVNKDTKVEFYHVDCGRKFDMRANNFIRGQRCPHCNESKGEKAIGEYLNCNGIKFKREYRFKDCRNKKTLPFDFAVFINKKLQVLVEYDGRQHFEAIDWFGGEKSLKYLQNNDEIKNNYCRENNIPLIRIPYTVKNIVEFLDNQFKNVI